MDYPASQVEGIKRLILKGEIYKGSHYNEHQLEEEQYKSTLIPPTYPSSLREDMDWLEDHPFLRGRIAVASCPGPKLLFETKRVKEVRKFFELTLGDHPVDKDKLLESFLVTDFFDWWRAGEYYKQSYIFVGVDAAPSSNRQNLYTDMSRNKRMTCAQKSIWALSSCIAVCSSQQMAEQELEKFTKANLGIRKEENKMDWQWYFAKYPEMRPKSHPVPSRPSEYDAYYYWYWRPRSFYQRRITKTSISSCNWNPFLYALHQKAGLPLDDFKYDIGSESQNYIKFDNGLNIYAEEYGWLIAYNEEVNGTYQLNSNVIEFLRSVFKGCSIGGGLNDNGYYYILGDNCHIRDDKPTADDDQTLYLTNYNWKTFHIDWNNPNSEHYRSFDHEDRIEIGLCLIGKIRQLKKETLEGILSKKRMV